MGGFTTHVELFSHPRHHIAFTVDHLGVEPAQDFPAAGGVPAQLVERGLIQPELRMHAAATRLDELDRAGLVPHVVVAPHRLHRQQHPERIGHREQAAAEVRADVVAVPGAHAQLDARMAVVVGDVGDVDAGKGEWRPQVQDVAQETGFRQLVSFIEQEWIELQGTINVTDQVLTAEGPLVEKFIRGTLKGFIHFRDLRAQSIALLGKFLRTPEDATAKIYELMRPSLTQDGIVSEEIQAKSLEHVVERAGLKTPPRLDRIFDYSLAVKVRNELRAKGWKP